MAMTEVGRNIILRILRLTLPASSCCKENTDKIILTNMADRLILNTFGEFINQCPDQKQLQEILKDLIPMQLGEIEPTSISIASEAEAQAIWDEEERNFMEVEFCML
jgi:hypothetical protein